MPPKQKFTREEILAASLAITRREGIAGITARSLAAELNSSPRPIFTVFQDMEEVQQETIQSAKALYNQYVQQGLTAKPAFKGVGIAYIRFATEEPKLFQLLFMTENGAAPNLSDVLSIIDENNRQILQTVQDEYALNARDAHKLYLELWIFTHGIAALLATGVCRFTEEEVNRMLTDVCMGLLLKLKKQPEETNHD